MSRRTPCRFHQSPGGCRRGQECDFLHNDTSSGSPVTSPREASASGPSTPKRTPVPVSERAPKGLCNEFWLTGDCKRKFDCRYKHELRQSPLTGRSPTAPLATPMSSFTYRFDATQVHNHLGKYLKDHYRFASPHDIYAFVSLIGHATKENNWVCSRSNAASRQLTGYLIEYRRWTGKCIAVC